MISRSINYKRAWYSKHDFMKSMVAATIAAVFAASAPDARADQGADHSEIPQDAAASQAYGTLPLFVAGMAARNARPVNGVAAAGTDPYPLYPALDRNTIPPHTSSGSWGSQRTLSAPTLPSGLTSANAGTLGAIESALVASNRDITLTANLDGGIGGYFIGEVISNCRINLNGFTLKGLNLGDGPLSSSRLEIVGPGKVGHIQFNGNFSDIVVRNCEIFGPGQYNGGDIHAFFHSGQIEGQPQATRIAFINCYAACGCEFWIGNVVDLVVAGCNVDTGLVTPRPAENDESWGFRITRGSQGYAVFVDTYIKGRRYHRIRHHGAADDCYVFMDRMIFADAVESRIWERSMHGGDGSLNYHGVWIRNTSIYATGGVPSFQTDFYTDLGVHYVAVVEYLNITCYSDTFTSNTQLQINGNLVVGGGVKTNSVFNAYTSPPAWPVPPGNVDSIVWNI